MTPAEIALVRQSWATIASNDEHAAEAGTLFYGRLFARNPELRPLFPAGPLTDQARKLSQMLGVAVASLDRLDTIAPAVEAMARRHAGYGVQDAHYDAVGAALLDTLALAHGPAFTPALRAAWAEAYGTVAGVMRRAAAPVPPDEFAAPTAHAHLHAPALHA